MSHPVFTELFSTFFVSSLADSEKGRIFAPAKPKGTIAQLVEQRTENPCVPGSIPGGTTQKQKPQLIFNQLRFFLFYYLHNINPKFLSIKLFVGQQRAINPPLQN